MTREEMKQRREQKKAERIAAKEQRKQERRELKSWNQMVERAKLKGAWIEN